MAGEHRGSKVGPRIAVLVSQAIVATHQKLIDTKHKLAMAVFRSMSDEISHEVTATLGPVYEALLKTHGDDGPLTEALQFMAYGHGQLKAIVGSSGLSQGLLSSVATVVNNLLAPGVYNQVSSTPHLIPDAGTIAQLTALGWISVRDGVQGIRENGMNNAWAEAMIEANKNYPDIGQILDLYRRGELTEGKYNELAAKAGYPEEIYDLFRPTAFVPLSPADLALAVLRGNANFYDAASTARESGVTQADFQTLVDNTGEPLGLEQMLEAFRRGFITEERLLTGIRQSRVRNEWAQTAVDLRYSPMSVADAVQAVVQNHMDQGTAESIAQQNGLEPGQIDILFRTAGEPLSRTEMEQLYNRGKVTQADVEQALRESRLKNKYTADAFALHERLLEPRMLSEAVHDGGMTHAEAIKEAMNYGFTVPRATVLVNSASRRKLQAHRERVVAAAQTLYQDSAITRGQLIALAESMGYEPAEAEFIAEASDLHKQARDVSSAIAAIRSRVIARHIDAHEASGLLDSLGVPAGQRDKLLGLWTIEEAANVRVLTPAQIVKAVKKELITPDEGGTRLMALGYSHDDAQMLLLEI
jgi:hypothetical protein